MAKATVATAVETVTTEVEEEVIQLTLSKVEARVLVALTNFVYGPHSTYNREVVAIRRALSIAGKFGYVRPADYFNQEGDVELSAIAHRTSDK